MTIEGLLDAVPPAAAVGAALILLVIVVVLTVALVVNGRRSRRLRSRRTAVDARHLDLDLSLAEQTARLRIVRELQDVAIRSVTELADEVDGVRLSIAGDPVVAARAAGRAVETAHAALADLRRIANIAREGEAASSAGPSLDSMGELVRIVEEGGLVVRFEEFGAPFPLRSGAEIAVFRICQRALFNSLVHGGQGTEVRVAFRWTETGLQIHLDDDGIRADARRRGDDEAGRYGVREDARALTENVVGAELSEMRARAELFGGTLDAHRVPGVGFSVAAFFPTLRHHNGIHGVALRR